METREVLDALNEWLGRIEYARWLLKKDVQLISGFVVGERFWVAKKIYEDLCEFRRRRVDPVKRSVREGLIIPAYEKERLDCWFGEFGEFLGSADLVLVADGAPFGIDAKIVIGGEESRLTLFDLWLLKYFSVLCTRSFNARNSYGYVLDTAVGMIEFLLKFAVDQSFVKDCFLSSSFGDYVCGEIVEAALEGNGAVEEEFSIVGFIKKFVLLWINRYVYKRLEDTGIIDKRIIIEDRQLLSYLVYYFSDWFKRYPAIVKNPVLLAGIEIYDYWRDAGEIGMHVRILDAKKTSLLWEITSAFWISDVDRFVDEIIVCSGKGKEELIKFFDSLRQDLDRRVELLRYIIFSGSDRVEIRGKDDV
jgi:hypothetical protein